MSSPTTTPGPTSDAEIPAYLEALGIPGLADIHVHFLPEPMLVKVWDFFDRASAEYGREWPIRYRFDEDTRLDLIRGMGVRAIPALTYPHKPGMAVWLNDWCAEFARRVPDAIHCATLYPEPGVGEYVAQAVADGARLFKMHVQVGVFAPDDPLLDPAWETLVAARIPVVIHAGSGPVEGPYTGPDRVAEVLRRHPELTLVIAHLGMPEYDRFADLAERFPNVHLDTTMAATDFTQRTAPMPPGYVERLGALADKVVLGSDFPNIPYDYAHQLFGLARLGLGDEWMRKVLWHNGRALLERAGA
ncbi:amidohydrolase [Tsukamurella sputi]|uniref:Amidohydrolase n=1 Tax=Tsukamurella sputi TaxID=2591848 RepID=A0A5C5RLA4_9ACTN|nr:amidohydrolase family protein [Tsukamurella sputi]TWS23488.1 amidohydrolase [Tsukamurella sputi]